MSHVFISHSSKDRYYAQELADALRKHGFAVWLDASQIKGGDDWWAEIEKGLQDSGALIVIMTTSSAESRWVRREVLIADQRDIPIYPVLLSGENWSMFVDRQYIDVRRSQKLPPDVFFLQLAETVPVREEIGTLSEPEPRTHTKTFNKRRRRVLVGLVVMASILGLGAYFLWPEPESLCVVGSGTVLAAPYDDLSAGEQIIERFQNLQGGFPVSVQAIGSAAGARLAADGGCVDVLITTTELTDDQLDRMDEAEIEVHCAGLLAYDLLGIMADINNPVQAITQSEFRRILLGSTTNWNEISSTYNEPITIFVREGSDITEDVLRNVARFDSQGGRIFPDQANYLICDSSDDCFNRVLQTPGSLYWASFSFLSTKSPSFVRILPLIVDDERPVNPFSEEVDLAVYPAQLIRPFYIYGLGQPNDPNLRDTIGFVGFARADEVQQLLEDMFFYAYYNQVPQVDIELPDGFNTAQVCK